MTSVGEACVNEVFAVFGFLSRCFDFGRETIPVDTVGPDMRRKLINLIYFNNSRACLLALSHLFAPAAISVHTLHDQSSRLSSTIRCNEALARRNQSLLSIGGVIQSYDIFYQKCKCAWGRNTYNDATISGSRCT